MYRIFSSQGTVLLDFGNLGKLSYFLLRDMRPLRRNWYRMYLAVHNFMPTSRAALFMVHLSSFISCNNFVLFLLISYVPRRRCRRRSSCPTPFDLIFSSLPSLFINNYQDIATAIYIYTIVKRCMNFVSLFLFTDYSLLALDDRKTTFSLSSLQKICQDCFPLANTGPT